MLQFRGINSVSTKLRQEHEQTNTSVLCSNLGINSACFYDFSISAKTTVVM